MKIYLKVRYKEKDTVKSLGALWDFVEKSWYVETRNTDLAKFVKYMHPTRDQLMAPHKESDYERQFRIAGESEPGKKKKAVKNNSHTSKNVARNAAKAAARAARSRRRLKKSMDQNRSKSGKCVTIYKAPSLKAEVSRAKI